MRRYSFTKAIIILLLAGSPLMLSSQNARIKIDIDRTIGEVNKNLYSNFVEHLGRCVYGGIWEPGSPLSDEQGFRKDVLEAVKGLNVSGKISEETVSNYHWLDGWDQCVTPGWSSRMGTA